MNSQYIFINVINVILFPCPHKYPTDAAVWPELPWLALAMSAAINFVIFDLAIRRESWPRPGSDGRQSDQFCDSGVCHWSPWHQPLRQIKAESKDIVKCLKIFYEYE